MRNRGASNLGLCMCVAFIGAVLSHTRASQSEVKTQISQTGVLRMAMDFFGWLTENVEWLTENVEGLIEIMKLISANHKPLKFGTPPWRRPVDTYSSFMHTTSFIHCMYVAAVIDAAG